GESYSADGDFPGNYGNLDAWLAKINAANGNVIWSYNYGGSGEDNISSICKANDGSASIAGAGGTTSPNDYNVTGNHGYYDAWIISFDGTSGILTRADCFGGSDYDDASSIKTTFDKGYIIAGSTTSNNGDVSYNADTENGEVWIVKLNNARTIDWEKTYGGPKQDVGRKVFEKSNGGYFAAANVSANGGDVSGYHTGTFDYYDYWALSLSKGYYPPLSSATIKAETPACGGTTTLSMPGGAGYFYHWFKNNIEIPGAESRIYTATTPGTYTGDVVVVGSFYYTYSPNSIKSKKPVATILPSGTVNKCAANTVTFTANTGAGLTYQWYRNNVIIAGATANTYTTKKAGKYKVYVYNVNTTCGKFSSVTTVNNTCRESIASAETTDESSLQLLSAALLQQNIPNPFNGSTAIQYSLPQKFTNAQIKVTDITGRVVKQFTLAHAGKGSVTLDAGMLAQSSYIYSLYVDNVLIKSKTMSVIK
ncbi:MAG: T9SS type A sorting domain-containing protein, partial [Panacibacter sp.]